MPLLHFQAIRINYGVITGIGDKAFYGLDDLKIIQLDNTELTKPPNIDYVGHTLDQILFRDNNISQIPNDYFKNATNIRIVSLSLNQIQAIPDLCYIQEALESLDFDSNQIAELGSLLECPFPKLITIRISYNYIKHLGLTCDIRLSNWPALTWLEMQNNELTSLPGLYCDLPDNATTDYWLSINTRSNPFYCDRSFKWMVS